MSIINGASGFFGSAAGVSGSFIFAGEAGYFSWIKDGVISRSSASLTGGSQVFGIGGKVGGFIASTSDGHMYSSSDGSSWTDRGAVYASGDYGRSCAYDGASKWVVVGYIASTASKSIRYSSNGTSWTEVTTDPLAVDHGGTVVVYANGLWLAGGSRGKIVSSSDGETWTLRLTGPSDVVFNSIIWDGSQYVAFGMGSFQTPYIYTSTNGTSWSSVSVPTSLYAVNSAVWTGSKYVVATDYHDAENNARISSSSTLTGTWTTEYTHPNSYSYFTTLAWDKSNTYYAADNGNQDNGFVSTDGADTFSLRGDLLLSGGRVVRCSLFAEGI